MNWQKTLKDALINALGVHTTLPFIGIVVHNQAQLMWARVELMSLSRNPGVIVLLGNYAKIRLVLDKTKRRPVGMII